MSFGHVFRRWGMGWQSYMEFVVICCEFIANATVASIPSGQVLSLSQSIFGSRPMKSTAQLSATVRHMQGNKGTLTLLSHAPQGRALHV